MTKLRIQHPHPPHQAMTLEQYRPLTDPPLGSTTAGRRSTDANASAAIPVTPKLGANR